MINVIPISTEHTITKKYTNQTKKKSYNGEGSFTLFLVAVVIAL